MIQEKQLFRLSLLWRILLCGVLNLTVAHAQAQQQDRQHFIDDILYINSYQLGYHWAERVLDGVKDGITTNTNANLYIEFMDSKRLDVDFWQLFYEYLKEKYKNTSIDLIILSDNNAYDFSLKYRDSSLFVNKPIVFCGVNSPEKYDFDKPNLYGVLELTNAKLAVDNMLKILPETKNLYFLADNTSTSHDMQWEFASVERNYEGSVNFWFINNASESTLIDKVSQLKEGDVVVMNGLYRDENGMPLNYNLIHSRIAEASTVPVFSGNEHDLGIGFVGGLIHAGYKQGEKAAELAVQLINNEQPTKIVTIDHQFIYDYQVLKRFQVDFSLLPEGAQIINKPVSFFAKYLKAITIGTSLFIVLLLIIVKLFVSNRNLKLAERKIIEHAAEIHQQNEEIEATNEQLTMINQELKTAMQKAEQSDALKTAFLANMSHEIRTPLNAISGFSSLLAEEDLDETQQSFIKHIITGSDNLARLINDILDLSKIETDQLEIKIVRVNLTKLLAEIHQYYTKDIDHKHNSNVQIVFDNLNHTDLVINADPLRLRQIITNLVDNALKYTENGSVNIGYYTNTDELKIYVKDSGIGIPRDKLNVIFERFMKIDNNRTKLYSGSGLGLAITKKLATLMNAHITVSSQEGVGSMFTVIFDSGVIVFDAVQASDKMHVSRSEYTWPQKTILIAEDVHSNYAYLEVIFRPTQVKILYARNGFDAVELFDKNTVDVVLMDLYMPEMDGYEACKLIKHRNPNIPVVAQTAYASPSDQEKCLLQGFDNYIAKPINKNQLLRIMSEYLDS